MSEEKAKSVVGFRMLEYKGRPIQDVDSFCYENGEKLVRYIATREIINPLTGALYLDSYKGKMPESFWKTLKISDGWTYKEIKEESKS